MNTLVKIAIICCVPLLFLSCVSTHVYEKDSAQFYENNILQEETVTLKKDSKVKETTEAVYRSSTLDNLQVLSRTETTNGGSKKMKVQLFEGDALYVEQELSVQESSVGSASDAGATVSGDKRALAKRAAQKVLDETARESDADVAGSTTRMLALQEQIQVDSRPNGKYIAYTILGKPFVMVGAASVNLLKCVGYAFINFLGGYNTVVNGEFFWKMPDVKKSKEKARLAREANRITVYPEYHVPFTNNHITVTETTSEAVNAIAAANGDVQVLSKESYVYDNTLSVERSAAADANSTAATIGFIGTIITVPVSVVTWIGGAAAGIYYETTKN